MVSGIQKGQGLRNFYPDEPGLPGGENRRKQHDKHTDQNGSIPDSYTTVYGISFFVTVKGRIRDACHNGGGVFLPFGDLFVLGFSWHWGLGLPFPGDENPVSWNNPPM